MSFTPEQIVDRIRLNKRLNRWRFIAIITIVFSIFFFSLGKKLDKISVIDREYIARVYIGGIIYNDYSRIESLKELAEDKNVRGVIIHVNTPGGSVMGGEALYRAIRKVAINKPTVVVMEDLAASAGYMIATAADYLIAQESTITGSIGVILESFEVTELAKKVGVSFHHFKSSPLKAAPIPTEPMTPEIKESINSAIRDLYSMFLEIIAKRRKIPLKELLKVADGRVYTGRQALVNKLVDALGDEETALEWLKSTHNLKFKVTDYYLDSDFKQSDSILDSIANKFLYFIFNKIRIFF